MSIPVLCAVGHLATLRDLVALGMTSAFLNRGIVHGDLLRVRRGVYACAHADPFLLKAASIGGAVSCVSVLRMAGVWAGHSSRLHLQVDAHGHQTNVAGSKSLSGSSELPGSGSFAGQSRSLVDLTLAPHRHWVTPRFESTSRWCASPKQALWQAMHCLDEENAIAAMESVIYEKFLPLEQVAQLAVLAPRRLDDGIRRMVPVSGSGPETVVRLRLERAGFRVEPQSYVPGMGHHDLLVEGCVGLDVDGRRWHGDDRFATDRDRDIHVEGFGRRALRLRYAHIFSTWPTTLAVIDRAVADARREQDRRHGRVIVRYEDAV